MLSSSEGPQTLGFLYDRVPGYPVGAMWLVGAAVGIDNEFSI